MSSFYSLAVADITRETKDCVSIAFDIPEKLKEKFNYLPGQYLTLKLSINGEEIRRSYSVCSCAMKDEKLRVAIKKVMNGKGSVHINECIKVGDKIEVMTPMGNFHSPLNASNKKTYVLFAGGSGITPMMSIIKYVLFVEPNSKLILFYGNENEDSIIFKKQLEELAASNASRLQLFHILNKPTNAVEIDFTGIMDVIKNKLLLSKYVDLKENNEYFICGPTGMMDSVMAALKENSIDKTKIHIEYFSSPESTSSETQNDSSAKFVVSKLTIICDGDEIQLNLKSGETVLEAALAANIDAPYACQGGSCCTCRAKLVEGKVHMKVNYALLDSEVEEGFILTCQSQALSPKLIVDYDRGR